MLASIIRMKILAIAVGVDGFGVWGILRPLIDFFENVIPQGFQQSVVRQTATLHQAQEKQRLRAFVGSSIVVFLFLAILSFCIVFFFADGISQLLTKSDESTGLIQLVALILPGLTFNGMLFSLLRGIKAVRLISIINVAVSTIMLAVSIPLILIFAMPGLLISMAIVEAVQIVILLLCVSRHIPLGIAMPKLADLQLFSQLGLILFSSSIIVWLTHYYLLIDYRQVFGKAPLGLFEAAHRLANFINAGVVMTMMAYVFPRMSEIRDSKSLSIEINLTLRTYLLVATPLIAVVALLQDEFLVLFYNIEFTAATALMPHLLMACFFQVIMWCFMITFIPQKKHAAYFIICLAISLLIPIFYFILRGIFKDTSLPVAMMIAYGIIATGAAFYLQMKNHFSWTTPAIRLLLASFIMLSIILFLPINDGLKWLLLPAWAIAGISLEHWKHYIQKYLPRKK